MWTALYLSGQVFHLSILIPRQFYPDQVLKNPRDDIYITLMRISSPYGLHWPLETASYTAIVHLNERFTAHVLYFPVESRLFRQEKATYKKDCYHYCFLLHHTYLGTIMQRIQKTHE